MEKIKGNWPIIVICAVVIITTLIAAYETNVGDLSLEEETFGIPFFLAPLAYLGFVWLLKEAEGMNKPEVAIGVTVAHLVSIVLLLMGGLVGAYWHGPLLIVWIIIFLVF